MQNCDVSHEMCCCKNVLELDKLCAKCAKICWLKVKKVWADEIHANEVCSQSLKSKNFWTETEVANDVCAQSVKAHQMQAGFLNVNNLCAQSGNMNDLCVNNLRVSNLQNCNMFRATAVLSAPTTYTLGTAIPWDVVLDDPNGNFSAGAGSYMAPKAGYYTVTQHIDMSNLQTSDIVLGTPVAHVEVYVNGLNYVDKFLPFLAFVNKQSAVLTALVKLNAGDVVTSFLDIMVVDQVSGLMDLVGTVDITGNGTQPGQSYFMIILHSELCSENPQCTPCAPVEIPCQPFEVPCNPVIPPMCDPCEEPRNCEEQKPAGTNAPSECEPCKPMTSEEAASSSRRRR